MRRILLVLIPAMVLAVLLRCIPGAPSLPGLPLPTWDAARFPWPMYAHDARRTGQSPFNGPISDPHVQRSWSYRALSAGVINIQAVVSDAGVFFGSWGVLRRDMSMTPDTWDKSDGRMYGLRLESQLSPAAQELFPPVLPAHTPTGYLLPGRTKLFRDVFWVGAGNEYLVSFFNGTIEGTPCIDPDDGTLYVGRGDGKLYAQSPTTGAVAWSFATFNPENPTDPDGGGEIIGGPVMGPDKVLYFGTVGLPWPGKPNDPGYETNAVYAVTTAGALRWRYPTSTASLDNWVYTPPAISPDGRTLYVGTFSGDLSKPGQLLAFDLSQAADASDGQRLKWRLDLTTTHGLLPANLYPRILAIGPDGRIYCGGTEPHLFGASPVVFAVDDRGHRGEQAWIAEPQGYPSTTGQFCNGLALRETNNRVDVLYATITHFRDGNGVNGGVLYAIDPRSGRVAHDFNPSTLPDPGIGGMTAPTLGADGTIYCGVRGRHPTLFESTYNGRMYAVRYDAAAGFSLLWQYEVEGQLDWVPPAIGANGGLYFGTSAAFPPAEQINWYTPTEMPANRSPLFYGLFGG